MIPVLLAALLVVGMLVSLLLGRVYRSRRDLEASRADADARPCTTASPGSLTACCSRTG